MKGPWVLRKKVCVQYRCTGSNKISFKHTVLNVFNRKAFICVAKLLTCDYQGNERNNICFTAVRTDMENVRYLIDLDLIFTIVKGEGYITTDVSLSVSLSTSNMTGNVLTKIGEILKICRKWYSEQLTKRWGCYGLPSDPEFMVGKVCLLATFRKTY